MFARIFTRVMLILFSVSTVWALHWTWTDFFQNKIGVTEGAEGAISICVILTIVESAVLVTALSLLVESFRSFDTIIINRTVTDVLLGKIFIEAEDGAMVRTCEVFALRSMTTAILWLLMAMLSYTLYDLALRLIGFAANPYWPNTNVDFSIDWGAFGGLILMFAISISVWVISISVWVPVTLLGYRTYDWIDKKMANKNTIIRTIVLGSYVILAVGLFMGAMGIWVEFHGTGGLGISPYLHMLVGIGVTFGLAVLIGLVLALAILFYKVTGMLVGKLMMLSSHFSFLGSVWNHVCPPKTVRVTR